MKRTKWEILEEKYEILVRRAESARLELEGLERAPFQGGEESCRTCNTPIPTEAAFAKHYLVDDERYLNLGNCPTRYNNGILMPALHNWWAHKDLWDEAHELNEGRDKLQAEGTPITLEQYNAATQVSDDREWCTVYGYEAPKDHTCIVSVCYEPSKD